MTIRYEELVQNPDMEMKRVGQFLGFRDIRYVEDVSSVDLGDWNRPHHARVHDPVDGTAMGRGRVELDLDDDMLERLAPKADPVLSRLSYEPIRG